MKSVAKLREQARRHEQKEEWDQAIRAYERVLEQTDAADEPDLQLYNRVGDLHRRVGRMDQAIEYYERAADHYAEASLYNNAIALCNKVLRYQPGRAETYRRLGRFSDSQGFVADARRYFVKYAETRLRVGASAEVLATLAEYPRLPDDPEALEILAGHLRANGEEDEAIRQLQRAYALWRVAEETERAQALGSKLLELDPGIDLEAIAAEAIAAAAEGADQVDDDSLPEIDLQTTADAAGLAGGGPVDEMTPEGIEPLPLLDVAEPHDAEASDDAGPLDTESSDIELSDMEFADDELSDLETLETFEPSDETDDVDPLPLLDSMGFEGLETTPDPIDLGSAGSEPTEPTLDLPPLPEAPDPSTTAEGAPEPLELETPGPGELDLDDAVLDEPEPEQPVEPERLDELEQPGEPEQLVESERPIEPEPPVETKPLGESDLDGAELEPTQPADTDTAESDPSASEGYIDLAELLFADDDDEPSGGESSESDPDAELDALLAPYRAQVMPHGAEDPTSRYDLGLAFKEMGLVDEAIAEFLAALDADDQQLKIYEELGQCLVQKAEYELATRVLDRALGLPREDDSGVVGVYYQLGRCHEELGQRGAARDAYERVRAVDATFKDVAQRLAGF